MKNFSIIAAIFMTAGLLFAASTPYLPEVETRFVAAEAATTAVAARVLAIEPAADASNYLTNGIKQVRIARATYSCAVSSDCAIGDHSLGVTLPANSLIRQSWFYNVKKPVSSGAGTLAFKCEDAGNIFAAATVTSASSGDVTAGVSTGVASTMVKAIGASCDMTASVASADYTTGLWNVFVEYVNHD